MLGLGLGGCGLGLGLDMCRLVNTTGLGKLGLGEMGLGEMGAHPSNFLIFFFTFCSQQYGQETEKILGKSLVAFSRKFHLKIAKFQFLPNL